MSPAGRPLKPDARHEKLNIRLTAEEKKEIKDCADMHGLTNTDAIIAGIRLLAKKRPKK